MNNEANLNLAKQQAEQLSDSQKVNLILSELVNLSNNSNYDFTINLTDLKSGRQINLSNKSVAISADIPQPSTPAGLNSARQDTEQFQF